MKDNEKFKETWKEKISTLKDQESKDDHIRKNIALKNAEDLKRQMEEKQRNREEHFRRELEEAELAKANHEN